MGGGSKFRISIFFGVFRNMNIFGGMKILWIFFGSSQSWASLRVISMQVRVFFKGQGTELGYVFGLLNYKYLFGVLEIPDLFWGER